MVAHPHVDIRTEVVEEIARRQRFWMRAFNFLVVAWVALAITLPTTLLAVWPWFVMISAAILSLLGATYLTGRAYEAEHRLYEDTRERLISNRVDAWGQQMKAMLLRNPPPQDGPASVWQEELLATVQAVDAGFDAIFLEHIHLARKPAGTELLLMLMKMDKKLVRDVEFLHRLYDREHPPAPAAPMRVL